MPPGRPLRLIAPLILAILLLAGCNRGISIPGLRLQVIRHGDSARHYLVIHANEKTAHQVLVAYMRDHPGAAFLVQGDLRNFRIKSASIDPNRMFSRAGAEKSLRNLNPGIADARVREVLDLVDRYRPKVLNALRPPPGGLIIVLHNNSEGYSIQDEIPISDRVSLKDPANPHDFFLLTDPRDFELVAASPYNAVLQRVAPKEDDGSLSRLSAREGIRYVNNEVSLGNDRKQMEMLTWLDTHLPQTSEPPQQSRDR